MNQQNQIQKDILRTKFSNIRKKSLLDNEKLIISKVKQYIEKDLEIKNKNMFIGIYWPIKGEVDLRHLKKTTIKKTALPGSNPSKMINYYPWLNKPLGKDSLKIPAPLQERTLDPEEISLLLIPALAIDRNGYRLGYGGGYFDRLRSDIRWRSIPSLIVLPQSCVSSTLLPREPWDIPFNGWISEKGLHKIQPDQSLVRLSK